MLNEMELFFIINSLNSRINTLDELLKYQDEKQEKYNKNLQFDIEQQKQIEKYTISLKEEKEQLIILNKKMYKLFWEV